MILADGAFDPLHIGHISYLQRAKGLGHRTGEMLFICVAPDDVIRAKGREPFQTRDERLAMLLLLRMVDGVCHEPLVQAIQRRRPRMLVKGVEWRGQLPADVEQACRDVGTDIVYVDTHSRTSTERLHACLKI